MSLRRLTTAVLVLCALSSACTSACSSTMAYAWRDERAAEYRIGPGDKLRVSVWKHEEVSGEVTVRPDGSFSLPLIGDVKAAGRASSEIATEIQTRLGKFYTESLPVTVLVAEVKSYKIYVMGEVQKPGEFGPSQPVTVMMGLAMAGGFTPYASTDHVVILRRDARGERRIPFSYPAVVKGGDLQQNLVLQSGDTIVVP